MGRLSGFKYREIVKRLKRSGFGFDRQAAGSHEIWYNHTSGLSTTIPNHPGDMPEGTLHETSGIRLLTDENISPNSFLQTGFSVVIRRFSWVNSGY
jgi:predicted RNA binding protein YcfA (HicA-like mRNA interferase family)